MPHYKLFVVAPRILVKAAKTYLEEGGRLDKSRKIVPLPKLGYAEEHFEETCFIEPNFTSQRDGYFLLPTTEALELPLSHLLNALSVKHDAVFSKFHSPWSLFLAAQAISSDVVSAPVSAKNEPLVTVIKHWLSSLPPTIQNPLISKAPGPCTVYPPLLLLSSNTFPFPWPEIQSSDLAPHLPTLFSLLRERFKVTHIAINAPIPPQISQPSDTANNSAEAAPRKQDEANRLRSPSNLIPLDGDFGAPFSSPPNDENLAQALWVSTIQHSIMQIWAPVHTMFSRGNIREKARVLSFCESTIPDPAERADSTALDLYAGIGYFAFCYAKAGMGLVLGWELNPWSVEGGKRGAEANGWGCGVVGEEEDWAARGWGAREARKWRQKIVFFHEDNEKATERIQSLKIRQKIPPVRHVNLGLLPNSRRSWKTAVKVLNSWRGGWVHAHENCPVAEIEERGKEIEGAFQELVAAHPNPLGMNMDVYCEHVERVKTYAPGIIHCVFDIAITPLPSSSSSSLDSR